MESASLDIRRYVGEQLAATTLTTRSDQRDYEYIVLGLGGFGSAAAYWLAREAGAEVLGLEQFELGHVRGESQDHSRIIRLSYHTPGICRAGQARLPRLGRRWSRSAASS